VRIKDTVFEYRLSGGERMAWHTRYHAHEAGEFELHYFLEGAGSFLNNNSSFPIRRGEVFLTGPHEFHSIVPSRPKTPAPISYYAVLFEPEENERELLRLLAGNLAGDRRPLPLDSRYHFMFEEIHHLSSSPTSHLRQAAAYQLLSFLFSVYGKDLETEIPRTGWVHVGKALTILRREVKQKLSVHDLAFKIGVSEEHLIRLFKLHMRMTPLQYSIRLRVEAASGYLISTNKTIGEISELFGFENQFHFSRVFKKCTGFPPSKYRESCIQLIDLTPPEAERTKK